MEQNIIFHDFARRAKEKIETRKKMKTKKLYIGDCDVTITISGLTEQEINDVNAFSEDTLECDKYLIYMACRELQEEADSLVKAGVIDQHYKIANMFKYADRRAIAEEIFTLSGINDKCTIKPVDEIEEAKN